MARKKKTNTKRPIESYEHRDKQRVNNPPVGLVTPETDPDAGAKKTYAYDPHLDPQLQWAGKAEHTSFEVPTVSLHVHERIEPRTILEAVRKRNGNGGAGQLPLFEIERQEPLRQAIEFYRHAHGWSNRLVAGDSLLVMNSLLEKEGLAGKVQMIYIDPPYGIKYGSNFQPFVNKRDVKDGKDEDLTAEPEQIRAFRDTWELGIHSYLTYLRDRLLLARELLTESGSVFVQISDENVHHVRELMDEVFGTGNFVNIVVFRKTTGRFVSELLSTRVDYIIWYARNKDNIKYRQLYLDKPDDTSLFGWAELPDGRRIRVNAANRPQIPEEARFFLDDRLVSPAPSAHDAPLLINGRSFLPGANHHWRTNSEGLQKLLAANRILLLGNTPRFVYYQRDFPVTPLTSVWADTLGERDLMYVVQTNPLVIQRCLLMTTDPGDLVFDPTCGSGTTAYVAEQWGRRWITCDTSRVALTLARQRLMTAVFDYYELAHPQEGVGSGFKYKTVPHVTLKSIANNPDIKEGMTREQIDAAIARHAPQETLYDQPFVDKKKTRVSGPFTVEAVPAPAVKSVEEILEGAPQPADASIARSGETLRQSEWRDELLRTGIRGKAGQHIRFARLEPLPGCRWLHADGETRPSDEGADRVRETGPAYAPQRIVVSFGPEHAPLEQRQVEMAWEEARTLVPKPKLLVFAAFQFDPEAAKDIDQMKAELAGMQFLKAQMNADLLTDDLKKKRASNESFWLIGQPDVAVVSEQWLVDSDKRMVVSYDLCKILSGVGRLAEINAIDEDDLRLYAAMAQRRDLWVDLADSQSSSVGSSQHRGGLGAAGDGGVHPVSGHRPGFVSRIGDAAALIERFGLHDAGRHRRLVEQLRGNRALTEWAAAFPLRKPLTTAHYSQVTVHGFDYYNTKTGGIESGGEDKIAVWLLDTDYDGRSLYPRQVFFPMAGENEGWARLAKNLKAEIDEELIEAYRGTVSLPFEPGEHRRIAVKIVDDRGIESLKILDLPQ
jgi:adenine-specific DNA-methyltransferase